MDKITTATLNEMSESEKTWTEKRNEVLPELFRVLREHNLTVSEAKSFLYEAQRLVDDRAKAV